MPFLDTNVFLRHLRQDHAVLSPKATALLSRIEQGDLVVRTSDIVVFETVFTLQRGYQQHRARIAEAVLPLLELPGIVLPGKRSYRSVFSMYTTSPLAFADCFHVILMQRMNSTEIYSFDTHFDRVPGLLRREG